MAGPSPLDLIREATEAARAGDKARTRELLLEATVLDPKNETAWHWLADVSETALEQATALERVLALNPNNDKAKTAMRPIRLKAGIEAAKAKNVAVARRLLTAAVAEDPGAEFGWLWLASVCDSPHEALTHLKRVTSINPNNAAAKKGIGYFEEKIKQLGPAAEPEKPAPAPRPARISATGSGHGSRPTVKPPTGKTVIVVDASRTIRKLVGVALGMDGFQLIEAADLTEAAERIREGVPDLLVVDIAAKGADVYEFCETFRQRPAAERSAVFLLTGKDGQFDRFRARAAGIDAFLSKPLQPELLLHTARSHQQAAAVSV